MGGGGEGGRRTLPISLIRLHATALSPIFLLNGVEILLCAYTGLTQDSAGKKSAWLLSTSHTQPLALLVEAKKRETKNGVCGGRQLLRYLFISIRWKMHSKGQYETIWCDRENDTVHCTPVQPMLGAWHLLDNYTLKAFSEWTTVLKALRHIMTSHPLLSH
jgi:hypothetical protein